jgi:hypothetical protein
MESPGPPSPADAATALADARRAQADLAAGLRLPGGFHPSIAAAITVQLATTAVGLALPATWAKIALAAGLALFAAVAAVQLARFRRLNGVWIAGFASRVVLGTATVSSLAYAAAFAGAVWASLLGLWWVTGVCAVAGGVAYAAGGHRWFSAYRGDPAAHVRSGSLWQVGALVVLAAAGLVLLVAAG